MAAAPETLRLDRLSEQWFSTLGSLSGSPGDEILVIAGESAGTLSCNCTLFQDICQ